MSLKSKVFLLQYDDTKRWYIRLPISKLTAVTSALPLFGFAFCVIWSLLYYFEDTTSTHCKVWNFLPSISAAIGNNLPQYIVWCTAITLHMPARFLLVALYYRRNSKLLNHHNQYLAKVLSLLSVIENLSLLGLTYVTSSAVYEYHEKFFLTFMATSEVYMLLTCLMLRYATKSSTVDKFDMFSVHVKNRLLIVNALSFGIAGYFFLRHNEFCEPGIYTFFAFFEYMVVLSNIGFHFTSAIDFRDLYITINKEGIEVR